MSENALITQTPLAEITQSMRHDQIEPFALNPKESVLGQISPETQTAASTIEQGFDRLQEIKGTDELSESWNSSTFLVENPAVVNHEVDMIDATASQDPCYKVFFKLNESAWTAAYKKSGDQPKVADAAYDWQTKAGGPAFAGQITDARIISGGDSQIFLIHSKKGYRAFDGLVEVRIPVSGKVPDAEKADVNMAVQQALVELTGNGATAEQASLQHQEKVFRDYFKLPQGPLSAEDHKVMDYVDLEQVSANHVAPLLKGLHNKIHLSHSPDDDVMPMHEFVNLEDAVDAVASGGLYSSLERAKRGMVGNHGRSVAADLLGGGADSVFTYAESATKVKHSLFRTNGRFVMRPESLDRLDTRAYVDDAYGSRLEDSLSVIDAVLDREAGLKRSSQIGYDDRIKLEELATVPKVSEICFEKSVGLEEMQQLLLPEEDKGSYNDFRWSDKLYQLIDKGSINQGTNIRELEDKISAAWGVESNTVAVLEGIGMSQKEAQYLCIGMNLPIVERVVARLQARGINEVNGHPVEEFVGQLTPLAA
jgi:hypothetical protein